MTFPAGDWEEVQRSAIDAWAKAHEVAAHEGKSVSGGSGKTRVLIMAAHIWTVPGRNIRRLHSPGSGVFGLDVWAAMGAVAQKLGIGSTETLSGAADGFSWFQNISSPPLARPKPCGVPELRRWS
jgi:hypothetical protein